MDSNSTHELLQRHQQGEFEQIVCDQCLNTFFTKLYAVSDDWVLLEKSSYGLEYFDYAIKDKAIKTHPKFTYICTLDEAGLSVPRPSKAQVFSADECRVTLLYLMHKMQHLDDENRAFFDDCVQDLDWKSPEQRRAVYTQVKQRHGYDLSDDIEKLFEFYQQHTQYLSWDLHGDNLMQSLDGEKILILDPFTINLNPLK